MLCADLVDWRTKKQFLLLSLRVINLRLGVSAATKEND